MLYRTGMWTRLLPLGSVLALFGASLLKAEDTVASVASVAEPAMSHRYAKIAPRNVFGVKPPPPVAPPEPVVEPPKEKPDFFLTGFTSIRGEKRAFICYQPKGKPMECPDALLIDVEVDGIKLLAINEDEESVRIAYNDEEITLNFDDNGVKANAAPVPTGGVPGGLPSIQPNGPRGSVPPPPVQNLGAPFNGQSNFGGGGNSGPTVIGKGGQVLGGFGNNNYSSPVGNSGLPSIQPNLNNGISPNVQAPASAPVLPSNPSRSPRLPPISVPFPSAN